MTKLGYEKNKRIVKVMGNQPKTVLIKEKLHHFKSEFEWHWSEYLTLLVRQKYIKAWIYEPLIFYFPNEKTAPVQYCPDFKIIENDDSHYWQELKGYHDGPTNSKLRRMARHYPDEIIELVLMRMPKKGKSVNRLRIARKYTRRIIDGGKILRQANL